MKGFLSFAFSIVAILGAALMPKDVIPVGPLLALIVGTVGFGFFLGAWTESH